MPLCDFDRICYEIRPCDVLLIEGHSRVSEIIKQITQSSWSHSALYIGRLHDIEDSKLREKAKQYCPDNLDAQFVIEGVFGKGTVISPLTEYHDDHIRICRPRGLSPRDAQNVLHYAINQLGTDYDVRQALDMFRLMVPWRIMPRHFRSKLFQHQLTSTAKTICSTVIAEAFNSVDFPILPHVQHDSEKGLELIYRNPKLYTPKDFDYSPYFEIIKYPFVSFDDYYRKLPWNKEGLISNDAVGISKAPNTAVPVANYESVPNYDTDQEVSVVHENVDDIDDEATKTPQSASVASDSTKEAEEFSEKATASPKKQTILSRIQSKRKKKNKSKSNDDEPPASGLTDNTPNTSSENSISSNEPTIIENIKTSEPKAKDQHGNIKIVSNSILNKIYIALFSQPSKNV
ncbi:MAG: hypothetical protein HOI53_00055 [Francisellaceae bacterium]|nr:hypothetical protein [Francisellaceae bacterium]MBT6206391.1 hypothetical protein [Francisellaceae bacterium]MBT6538352.1 hypothetical protein [Francisellaceae bacterium]